MNVDAGPLVTVIIPAFNAQATLPATLASVQAQTHSHLEVLVVDDGSRDQTATIVANVSATDPRVRLLRQQNSGVAEARNHALTRAKGAWTAPLDADDLWHTEKLSRQLNKLRDDSEAGVCYCWSVDIDERSHVVERRLTVPRFEGWVYRDLLVDNFLGNSSSPLIRTDCLQAIGGWDTSLRRADAQGCEDWDIYLKLAARTRFILEPGFLVGYRQTAAAMSRDIRQMKRSHAIVMDRQRRSHPEVPGAIWRRSAALNVLYLGKIALSAGDWAKAVALWAQAAMLCPRTILKRSVVGDILRQARGMHDAGTQSWQPPGEKDFSEIETELPKIARHIVAMRGKQR